MRSGFLCCAFFLGLMLCLPAGGYAIDGDLDSDIPDSWEQDWLDFNTAMLAEQKKAKDTLAKHKKKWDEIKKEKDSEAKTLKQRKLAKLYWGVKKAYYNEKLKRLAKLKAKYAKFPELVKKIDNEIKIARAELAEADEKEKKDLAKLGCGEILGVPMDCPVWEGPV